MISTAIARVVEVTQLGGQFVHSTFKRSRGGLTLQPVREPALTGCFLSNGAGEAFDAVEVVVFRPTGRRCHGATIPTV